MRRASKSDSGGAAERGCELCLDAAPVAEVVAVAPNGHAAEVTIGGQSAKIATDLVGPVAVGDRLLVHAGVAISRIED